MFQYNAYGTAKQDDYTNVTYRSPKPLYYRLDNTVLKAHELASRIINTFVYKGYAKSDTGADSTDKHGVNWVNLQPSYQENNANQADNHYKY